MKCNSNCSCNRSNSNCGGCGNRCDGTCSCGCCTRQQMLNQASVFVAYSNEAQTAPTTADTPLPLTLTNTLYNYGCAIQATTGTSRIFITQPGLYQVTYYVIGTNTTTSSPTITAYILKNTTQIGTTQGTIVAADDSIPPFPSTVLTATENLYVGCQELPLVLSLNASSSLATDTTGGVNFTFFITINKVCSCNGNCSGLNTSNQINLNPFFLGCESGCNSYPSCAGPGPAVDNGYGCGFGNGYNNGCGNSYGNSCGNGCWS